METIEEMIRAAGKLAVIAIDLDGPVNMARVLLNGKWIMEGNTWDFHPACHRGLTQELAVKGFAWSGIEGLVAAIRLVLPKDAEVEIQRETYRYA